MEKSEILESGESRVKSLTENVSGLVGGLVLGKEALLAGLGGVSAAIIGIIGFVATRAGVRSILS